MKKPVKKCRKNGGVLTMCDALNDVVDRYYGASSGRGLSLLTTHYIRGGSRGDIARQMVVIRDGKHAKKGVAMNYCPFCGADHKPEQYSKEENAKGGGA